VSYNFQGSIRVPRIYTAKARFYHQKKIGNTFDGAFTDVELEICDINKFGNDHRDIFRDKNVEKLYCFKKMDYTIAGHSTYDIYNYFQIFFYPCHNTTENGKHCEDINLIKTLLSYTGVTVKIQDLELTPENYKTPTTPRARELTAPVMASLYQNINAYFHIISIESDTDIIGFEGLAKYDVKKAFKYDVTFIMTSTNSPTAIDEGAGYCDITIQLTEQVITIKRTYTKLIEALGDVGGLMEFIFSFFRILASFLTESLYEKSLVNSLFSFDLDKKIVLLKNHKNKNKDTKIDSNTLNNNEEKKEDNQDIKELDVLKPNEVTVFRSNSKKRESSLNKSIKSSEQPLKEKRYSKFKKGGKYHSEKNVIISRNYSEEKDVIEQSENNNDKNLNYDKQTVENRTIMNKIKFQNWQLYFCFLCLRKFKNYENSLIDEGMQLITCQLDIRNIFKNMLRIEKVKEQFNIKDRIQMSNECKNKLNEIVRNSK